MRLATSALIITLMVLFDPIECSDDASSSGSNNPTWENFVRGEPDGVPPPPHLRRKPEPFPDTWILYPYPYYYDANGVIRDYMNPGSEGIVVRNTLIGMLRPNRQKTILMRNRNQYVITLHDRKVHYRPPGSKATNIL